MYTKLHFIFMLCVCTIALVAALPYKRSPVKSYMVSEIANMTLCPLKIEVKSNEKRIPRFIKFIECDVSESSSSDSQHCSSHPGGDHVGSCVQLVDFAPVQYLKEDGSYENSTLKVPVGCACMANLVATATNLDES